MQRRSFLIWITRTLEVTVGALVAVPGVRYIWNTLQPSAARSSARNRLVRLKDLRPGEPTQFSIKGERRDAWHVEPQQVIGRVWLVRQADSPSSDAAKVAAFSSVCPHMGCQIQRSTAKGFMCPCHKAAFQTDGHPLQVGIERNHAPRGLDQLPCEVIRDKSGELWVEVEFQRFETGLTQKVLKA